MQRPLKSDLHLNPPNTGAQGGCSPQVVEQQHSHHGTYVAVIGDERPPASAVGVDGQRRWGDGPGVGVAVGASQGLTGTVRERCRVHRVLNAQGMRKQRGAA